MFARMRKKLKKKTRATISSLREILRSGRVSVWGGGRSVGSVPIEIRRRAAPARLVGPSAQAARLLFDPDALAAFLSSESAAEATRHAAKQEVDPSQFLFLGLLAFHRHAFDEAVEYLERFAARHPKEAAGQLAAELARLTNLRNLTDPNFVAHLRAGPSGPDGPLRGGRLLVLADADGGPLPGGGGGVTAETTVVRLGASRGVAIAVGGDASKESDDGAVTVKSPSERLLEGACQRIVRRINGDDPAVAAAVPMLAEVLKNLAEPDLQVLLEVERRLRADEWDAVSIVVGRPGLFVAAEAVCGAVRPDLPVHTVRLVPPLPAAPGFVHWASREAVDAAARAMPEIPSRMSYDSTFVMAGVTPETRAEVIAEIERLRRGGPVLAFIEGADPHFEADVLASGDGTEGTVGFVHGEAFEAGCRVVLGRWHAPAGVEGRAGPAATSVTEVFLRHALPRYCAEVPEFAALLAAQRWTIDVVRTAQPGRLVVLDTSSPLTRVVAKTAGAVRATDEARKARETSVAGAPKCGSALLVPFEGASGSESYGGRAAALLARRAATDPSVFASLPISVMPDFVERHVFDMALMRRVCERFLDWPRSAEGRAAGPEFALLRGLVSYYRHDFAEALDDLRNYAKARPNTSGGMVARDLVRQLGVLPYDDPHWVELMSAKANGPDPAKLRGRNLLVVTEAGPDQVEAALKGLPRATRVTVSFPILFDLARQPLPNWTFHHPPRDIWYKEEGWAVHRGCERVSSLAAEKALAVLPGLAHAPFAMKMAIVDRMLDDYLALTVFDSLLAGGDYDEVVVVTRRYSFYRTVRDLVGDRLPADRVSVAFINRPSVRKGPAFVYWPPATLPRSLAKAAADRRSLALSLRRKIEAARRRDNRRRPAVFVWTVSGRNERLALERVVQAALRHRPVVVIATAGDPTETAEIGRRFEALGEASGRWLEFVQYDTFLKEGPAVAWATVEASRAVSGCGPEEQMPLDRFDAAVLAHDLPQAYVAHAHVAAMHCMADWIAELARHVRPAFVTTSPGRNFIIASAMESFHRAGVPSLDVELSLIGNQARQLQPPMDYYATIDSGHADFVVDFWGFPRERIITVGYLWSALTERAPLPERNEDGRFHILYASQPAPKETSEPIVECIMQVMSEFPEARLTVKLHPRDEVSAARFAEAAIERFGLSKRAEIAPTDVSIEPLLDRCDLVVLRNSAVGMEAVGREKPLLRCLAYDLHLARALLDVPYAINTYDVAEFGEQMRRLVRDPEAREDVRRMQRAYAAENPCLFVGGGHEVLDAYLENTVVRFGRPRLAAGEAAAATTPSPSQDGSVIE